MTTPPEPMDWKSRVFDPELAHRAAKMATAPLPEVTPEEDDWFAAKIREEVPLIKHPVYRASTSVASDPLCDLIADLKEWWGQKSAEDAILIAQKYQEYGNHALLNTGYELASLMGRQNVSKAEAQELGIYFFMMGKMSRWKNAILNGERVSEDTVQDLTCYAMMARRVHEKDGWPNA